MPQNSFPRWLLAVLTLAVLAVAAGGFWFYHAQEQLLRQKAETHLQAIAQLKADQIADWRGRSLTDAAERMESPFADEALLHWLATAPDGDTAQILDSFRSLQRYHHYRDVLLVDAAGQTRLSLSGRLDPLHAETRAALVTAWRDRRPILTDLHAGPGDLPAHIETVAPLYTDDGAPAGAIILQCDAQQFLYPLVQSWPIPSQSAETLLVRRDDDAVLFLNNLRHQPNTALNLRIPLSQTNVPAVMAVLGQTGVVQGYDYRGVEVLSVLQPVPNSSWYMIAKVDTAEALAVWQTHSMLVVALILGFVAAIAAATGVVWQRNQKVHYRALFQAEVARRASEERYRVTLMSVGDGIIAADAAGRVDLLNPAAEALTGWRQEEAQGRPLEEVFCIVNEETRRPVENPAAAVMRQGMVVGLANHTLLLARDGAERPIADSGAPIRGENGQISGVVLVFHDQTQERVAQKALQESEEKFRRLVELSVDGIVLIDEQGRIVEWNQGQEQITGLKRAEVAGRPLWEVQFNLALPEHKTPAALEQIKANIIDFLRTGNAPWQNQLVESEFQATDGTRRFMQSIAFPIRTAKGIMAASIARDITTRKQAEEQIKASLREKEVMLQEIHHRVKNNLQVICSLLDMQADAVQDPRVLQALQDSQQRVRSMALVHEKLYQAEDLTRVDFDDYIQEMTAYLLMAYSDLTRPVTPRLEVEQVFLGVDKAIPCGLIVNELVSNALKYAFSPPPSSPSLGGIEGGDFPPPEIRVSFARSDGEYTLIVGDNGMGLPASVDVDNLPSLGLRLVKILTDQLQGALEIERNHGTTFKLTFPENHQKSRPRFS